ncbi:PREDICTED: uncharacterized protein LOC105619067 isoform X1 [Atta cephalotes]|uniref:Uncharacterized protein n=1 Tax=Atta cephalotes TaxID=12957 RepID=A0A158NEM8_ATTCE|nr:PREDICTED: uncharacterized protein LOC105619067 isoform X1 [Atta cephalotes]
MYRTFLGATAILMMIELNVYTATDWWWGAKDPFGPYPRIPNKDLVKKLHSQRSAENLSLRLKMNGIRGISLRELH